MDTLQSGSSGKDQDEMVDCDLCGKRCKVRGLKIHQRIHKDHPPPSSNTPKESLFKRLSFLKLNVKVLKRIPKAARMESAFQFSKLINAVTSLNNSESWENLLIFAFKAFSLRKIEGKKVSLATSVKRNFSSNLPILPSQVKKYTANSNANIKKVVQAKLDDGNISGAIRVLSSKDSIAPFNQETFDILKNQHPPEKSELNFLPFTVSNEDHGVSRKEILDAILSFLAGSSGGLDGLRPQHLKDMVSPGNGEAAEVLIKSLAKLINLLLNGQIPEEILPVLYGASLTPIQKKDGGIRPIAVGLSLRRMAGKIGCKRVSEEIGSFLRPRQHGFGSKGGAEAIIHAARNFLNQKPAEVQIFAKLDFYNAFNMVHRDHILRSFQKHCPSLYNFIYQSYRSPTLLQFGDNSISSECGYQQGDPCGSLGFYLAIISLAETYSSEFISLFLDDISLGGTPENVLKDLNETLFFEEQSGLILNIKKCEFFIFGGSTEERRKIKDEFSNRYPGILFANEFNLSLLGSPLFPEGLEQALDEKINSFNLMSDRLSHLDRHPALFLLKNAIGIPKLVYLLRTSPTWEKMEKIKIFDELMHRTLEKLTNVEINDVQWDQASLPTRLGGLGVRKLEDFCYPAYISSYYSTQNLISDIFPSHDNKYLDEALINWKELSQKDYPEDKLKTSQNEWDSILIKVKHGKLLKNAEDSGDMTELARLKGVSNSDSSSWLNALSIPLIGTFLDNDSLRIAVGLRIGSSICVPHICKCGAAVDKFGRHGLSCGHGHGRITRHASLNETIKRALTSAGHTSILEPIGLSREGGKRPDGMTLIPWKNGRPLVWDATCSDTLAKSHITKTSINPGAAANSAETYKTGKYACIGLNYTFIPLGFETLGPFGKESSKLLKEIGQKIFEKTFEKRSPEFLSQKISIDIQRGNSIAVLSTLPDSKSFNEIFNIPSSFAF